MKLNVYTVLDKAVNAYLQPFYARGAGEAIRSFSDLANDGNTNIARHPEDFILMFLGEYDDASGLFNCQEPMRLVGATEVIQMDPRVVPEAGSYEKSMRANGGAG